MSDKALEAKLQEPFSPDDVKWRVQRSGLSVYNGNKKPWAIVQPYITGRAIQSRLDDVFGIGGWEVFQHETAANDGFICTLKVLINDRWVTKQDVAQKTDIEALKGGASGALKRAGVLLGIGRYLYRLKPEYADCVPCEKQSHATGSYMKVYADNRNKKSSEWMGADWMPPQLPNWALPGLDSSEFIEGITTPKTVVGVTEGYNNAINWAHSFSRQDLVEDFEKIKNDRIETLQNDAIENVNSNRQAIEEWLEKEMKNIALVPDVGAVHKVCEHIRRRLAKQCEDQLFDAAPLVHMLKSEVQKRVNQLNSK